MPVVDETSAHLIGFRDVIIDADEVSVDIDIEMTGQGNRIDSDGDIESTRSDIGATGARQARTYRVVALATGAAGR